MNIKHLEQLCNQLKQISSTKEKEKFLIENRCDDFNKLLKFLLDPSVTTGIDRKKLNKDVDTRIVGLPYVVPEYVMDEISKNNTGSKEYVALCKLCMENYPEHSDFLADVFTKNLKIGVNVKTVNKVYGKDFIYVHEVRLGSSRDKLRLKEGQFFSLSQKMDGVRSTFVNGKMISRQGKVMNGLQHITSHLQAFNERHNTNLVFDGELIRANVDGIPDNENFRLTTSIVNSEEGDKSQLEFVVFDCLPLDEFYNGESKDVYKVRRDMVENAIINMSLCADKEIPIRPVPIFYQGTDQSEIDKQLEIADAKGCEGLMLDKNTKYYCKRDTGLVKIKKFKHSDLRIIDCLEGDGKYKGVLGAFVVEFKNNTVNVGSGFSDQQRIDFWVDRDNLIDKICQVKYKEVSKDKYTGFESLQFPIFEMLRDKDEVSYE